MFRFATFKKDHGKLSKRSISIVLLLSTPLASLAQPVEVAASNVQSCRYLNMIEGSSGYGKKYEWRSFAKNSVLTQAEKQGASHVVWEQFIPVGAFNGIAIAKTYNCNS